MLRYISKKGSLLAESAGAKAGAVKPCSRLLITEGKFERRLKPLDMHRIFFIIATSKTRLAVAVFDLDKQAKYQKREMCCR